MILIFRVEIVRAANVRADEAAAYANFIQNLVNNSSIKKRRGSFCIYGNDPVARALMASEDNVSIKQANIRDSYECKAVYISVENIMSLRSYLNDLASNKILTIGTFDEFVENGGMIQVEMGRRNFELVADVKTLNSAQIKLDTLSTNLIVN
jgi:hypothetical protein